MRNLCFCLEYKKFTNRFIGLHKWGLDGVKLMQHLTLTCKLFTLFKGPPHPVCVCVYVQWILSTSLSVLCYLMHAIASLQPGQYCVSMCVCVGEREWEKKQRYFKSDTCVTSTCPRMEIILIFHTLDVDICKITLWGLLLPFELELGIIKYYEFLFFLIMKRLCGNSRARVD